MLMRKWKSQLKHMGILKFNTQNGRVQMQLHFIHEYLHSFREFLKSKIYNKATKYIVI